MFENGSPTRILFIDNDEATFQIRQCMAQALEELPPVELFHARDATEALALLESLAPDVIVLDDEEKAECDLFMDSLATDHPPIVLCREDEERAELEQINLQDDVTYLPKCESLDGFHQTLKVAAAIGMKFTGTKSEQVLH